VQIEVEAVLHGGAVDLGDEPACLCQRKPVEADPGADPLQLCRRLPRMAASPAADMQAELAGERRRPRFSAPITLVVMPEECQSMPITAPKDWNQKGAPDAAATRRGRNAG
jgi:hypothetical protein